MRRSRPRACSVALLTAIAVLTPLAGASATHHQSFGELVRPGVTELISVASDGSQGNGDSGSPCPTADGPSISDDGRFVAFTSLSSNFDKRDVNGSTLPDVYLRDRTSGRTKLVSVSSAGVSLPELPGILKLCQHTEAGTLGSYDPAISGDGRFIAFVSAGQVLDGGGSSSPGLPGAALSAIYVHDRLKGTTELISKAKAEGGLGMPKIANGRSDEPAISQNGRYVSFVSEATNLVETGECSEPWGDVAQVLCGGFVQAYRYDRKTQKMDLVSVTSEGVPADRGVETGSSSRHSLSDDGRSVVFESRSNLTPNDQNLCVGVPLHCTDVFVHDVKAGKTELISVGRDGVSTEANSGLMSGQAQAQAVSADGRFVTFYSDSRGLVPENHPLDSFAVYVRDRKSNRTERITTSSGGYSGSDFSSISDDGRFVLATGPGGPRDFPNVNGTSGYVRHDRKTGQTDFVRIIRYEGELQENGGGWRPVMSGSGRHFVWTSLQPHGPDDKNGVDDVWIRDMGVVPAFGTAFFDPGPKGRIAMADSKRFSSSGLLPLSDADDDSIEAIGGDAEILQARLVYRGKYDDLYARIELDRLTGLGAPLPLGSNPLVVYGIEFRLRGVRYQARIAGGLLPRFGLFRCTHGRCDEEVASLKGGYGTAGESVIATLPVELLGEGQQHRIARVRFFSALGTYELGPQTILDEARL